ncbi:hypothetical protein B0H11DRAFT_2141312 [Mycena galericulata]|nr:hypothetical protein B0H11DRAFT_2141312 [Mycena galericulata]
MSALRIVSHIYKYSATMPPYAPGFNPPGRGGDGSGDVYEVRGKGRVEEERRKQKQKSLQRNRALLAEVERERRTMEVREAEIRKAIEEDDVDWEEEGEGKSGSRSEEGLDGDGDADGSLSSSDDEMDSSRNVDRKGPEEGCEQCTKTGEQCVAPKNKNTAIGACDRCRVKKIKCSRSGPTTRINQRELLRKLKKNEAKAKVVTPVRGKAGPGAPSVDFVRRRCRAAYRIESESSESESEGAGSAGPSAVHVPQTRINELREKIERLERRTERLEKVLRKKYQRRYNRSRNYRFLALKIAD